jgi:hypothetical protein
MPRWRLMCSQQHYRKNMTIKLSYYNDRIIRYNKKKNGWKPWPYQFAYCNKQTGMSQWPGNLK